jgi:plasmid stabilization system protein ParE
MAHKIGWSRRALQDLEAIAAYISQDSPAYANVMIRTIVNQTKMLGQFPRSGRKVPESTMKTFGKCWLTTTASFTSCGQRK